MAGPVTKMVSVLGINIPISGAVRSRIALASGVFVPIPTLFCANEGKAYNKLTTIASFNVDTRFFFISINNLQTYFVTISN